MLNLGMALTGAVADHVIVKGANPSELNSREHISNVLNSTGRIPPIRAKSVNPFSTNTLIRPEVKRLEDVDYAKLVLPHGEGEQRDILFGHGLETNHV
jgi:hypothetical protein